MSQFKTMADMSEFAKYFTKAGWNLTRQGEVYRYSPALHERMKAEGAEADRTLAERVAAIDKRIAELQVERARLLGK
jgi:hypothetical protein